MHGQCPLEATHEGIANVERSNGKGPNPSLGSLEMVFDKVSFGGERLLNPCRRAFESSVLRRLRNRSRS